MWRDGLSYETYLAGGYSDPVGCWDIGPFPNARFGLIPFIGGNPVVFGQGSAVLGMDPALLAIPAVYGLPGAALGLVPGPTAAAFLFRVPGIKFGLAVDLVVAPVVYADPGVQLGLDGSPGLIPAVYGPVGADLGFAPDLDVAPYLPTRIDGQVIAGSDVITIYLTGGPVFVGMTVTGICIPAGTTVISFVTGYQVVMSANASCSIASIFTLTL
jgi:hypothetical protein